MTKLKPHRQKKIDELEEIDVCDACLGKGNEKVCALCPLRPGFAEFLESGEEK